VKVGDIVAPKAGNILGPHKDRKGGIIIDSYEDDYGIVFYEVHWNMEAEWWKEDELNLISEAD